jgi:hypothetical protein
MWIYAARDKRGFAALHFGDKDLPLERAQPIALTQADQRHLLARQAMEPGVAIALRCARTFAIATHCGFFGKIIVTEVFWWRFRCA